MRAYVVVPIEFDPDAGETLDMKMHVLMSGPKEHYEAFGEQFTGPISVTIDQDDMDLIDDIFKPAEVSAGKHVAVVTDVQPERALWSERDIVVEHSLRCRRSGQMADCLILPLARVAVDAGHLGMGRHEVRLREDGVLLWGDDL